MKIICKYEISSESVITPKEAILYIDGNLSEKDSKNETENMKRATYLKVEKAPTKRYDEYYKDGKQITSQDLMANNKTAPKQTRSSIYYTARCWEKCWLWSYSSVRTYYFDTTAAFKRIVTAYCNSTPIIRQAFIFYSFQFIACMERRLSYFIHSIWNRYTCK